jgi:lipid-A-disaccharide synthase
MSSPTFFLSAGEASGEHYGRLLIEAISKLNPGATFFGLGGQRMEAVGLRRIVKAEDVAVMGITEVVRHMPRIYGEYRKLKQSIQQRKPDAAILIDFPDVNLSLARHLHRLRIPVIFFVSPQLWAWKKHRINQVQRYVDRMLVIFPFEEPFYKERGVAATFVGHPLADSPLPSISRPDFATENGIDASKQWIALLPGSRPKEIELNLPTMLEAVAELNEDSEFILPLAPTLTSEHRTRVAALLAKASALPHITLVQDARAGLFHARASVVASGTATVEAALIGNPFVVVYRISDLSYAVAKRVVKVPFVAMVNLIAGREAVPELIQGDFTSANVVLHLRRLLHNEEVRETMKQELRRVAAMLHPGDAEGQKTAIDRVAKIAVELASRQATPLIPSPSSILSQTQ